MIGQSLTVSPMEWHKRFMRLAVNVSMWSKDPDKQVGALVVSTDRRRFSAGYNGLPWGMPDDPEVLCNKDLKNALTIHAEQNAMANAPFDLAGWTIYSTTAPCLHCALAIRQHRLSHLVCAQINPESRWADEQHQAKTLLENLGVQVTWVSLEHLFD
jgi:dCMP deaminase